MCQAVSLIACLSIGFDHPCTAEVSVYAGGNDNSIAVFSLDLVSPVEYLFRKFTMDDSGEYNLVWLDVLRLEESFS